MVINGELFPPAGHQYQPYAYTDDHYQTPNRSYAHEEDYYAKDDFYESSSSSINMKPNPYILSPQPPTHHVAGLGGHGHGHGHGKYSNGITHTDDYYSGSQDYYGHGHGNGMPPLNGMHHDSFNSGYEAQHGAYMHMGPNRHDYGSHGYYGESVYPPYGEKYKHNNNWAGKGAKWISKGI